MYDYIERLGICQFFFLNIYNIGSGPVKTGVPVVIQYRIPAAILFIRLLPGGNFFI